MSKFKEEIVLALKEDIPIIDVSSTPIFKEERTKANLIAKENGIIAGIEIFTETFKIIDENIKINWNIKEGQNVQEGMLIATIEGKILSILQAERVALNYLQRISGIATLTNEFVKQTKGYKTKIYDTRKTTPNFRNIEKYAVTLGGGYNHRFNLSDMIMLKDNHIKGAGSITKAVKLVKVANPDLDIVVECETLKQVQECLDVGGINIIMLDNMDNQTMKEAIKKIDGKYLVEASGNMSVQRIQDIAKLGIDRISVGALTHSYKSLDISLKF